MKKYSACLWRDPTITVVELIEVLRRLPGTLRGKTCRF